MKMKHSLIRSMVVALIIIMIIAIFTIRQSTTPVITYFPNDDTIRFKNSATVLQLSDQKKYPSYQLDWRVSSQSDQPLYLRQDVSLLFANGQLKGVKSKWADETDTIQMDEQVTFQQEARWEAISFHHGENHLTDDTIKSIQQMTREDLYIFDTGGETYEEIKTAHNKNKKTAQEQLNHTIDENLNTHLNKLMSHFNITKENYLIVPLVDLYQFNEKNLPALTQQQTNKIMGQLWEGLYENYILSALNLKTNQHVNYMPFILFDKNHNHLIVLYELDQKKEMLIQRYSD